MNRILENNLPFDEVCRLPENNIKQYLIGLFYCLGFGCMANLKIDYNIFTELQKKRRIITNTCIAFVQLAVYRDKYESYNGTDNFIQCDIEKNLICFIILLKKKII